MTREEMRYKLNELRMMLNDGEHGEEQGVLVEIISELDKWEEPPIYTLTSNTISALSENKGDLINRQAVLNTLDNMDKALDEDRTVEKYKELLTECINELPSAENKGEWVFDETLDKHYYCSECKSMGVSYWDYCPYCGARMKGGE